MAEFIVLPKMTLTMEEGFLGKWYVREGDVIKYDDLLCSVENEKEVADVLSVYEGTILKLIGEEGETYPANAPIAVVGEPGEDFSALMATAESGAGQDQKGDAGPPAQVKPESAQGGVQGSMMPKVRKLIQEKGIDIGALIVFCDGRKITEAEVEAFEQSRRGQGTELRSGDEVVKASAIRKTVAKNMKESCDHTASLTNFIEADLTDAFALMDRLKAEGKKISVTSLFIKAAAYALREYRIVNSVYNEDAGEIIYRGEVNISCAVDMPEGLAVPVILNADKKDVLEISGEIAEFAKKGKEGALTNDDMKDGTFTVSNIGMFDALTFTPIINYPQAAILGVGTVRTLPRYTDDDFTKIEPRKIAHLAITYDHRVIDGAPAARFLQRVKALLQEPRKLVEGS